MANTQVSAYLSDTTREQLERYAKEHGVKKGHLVEEALLHHLLALRELPADVIVPPTLELTSASFAEVSKLVVTPRKPTKALKALMAREHPKKTR